MKKIILIGYMASGKTTIAKIVATKLGISNIDLDHLIEKETNLSLDNIFSEKGEIFFRKMEHSLFKKLVESKESLIISTGGGTPCYADNHFFLNGEGVISIYLKGSIELLNARLLKEKSKRPLVAQKNEEELKDFIAKQLFERSYYYNMATFKISIDGKNPEEIASEVFKLLV